MFLVIILDDRPDIEEDVDGLVLDGLVVIVQQLIKHAEDLVGRLILLDLRALFLHELDQGDKLVQESDLDLADLRRQDVQRHDEAVHQEALLDLIGKVHQSLREVQFVVIVEILDIRLNRLLRGKHAIVGTALIRLCICIFRHFLECFHSCLEAHLCLLDISATELTSLELRIDGVSLLILKVEELLINEGRVETRPTGLE